jgi:hypothetical protein
MEQQDKNVEHDQKESLADLEVTVEQADDTKAGSAVKPGTVQNYSITMKEMVVTSFQ